MTEEEKKPKKIGVLGGGSWGTALAVLLAGNGHAVTVGEINHDIVSRVTATRENPDFLPGVKISPQIEFSGRLEAAAEGKDMIFIVVPSQAVRPVVSKIKEWVTPQTILVSCSKGIESGTLLRMSQVIGETVSTVNEDMIAVLSGPSHAEEVGRGMPTVVTVASTSPDTAELVQETCMNPAFRVYSSRDVAGVELGGALKNIIALAAGIVDGLGYGDNTKAALMTRGIVEMTRLGTAMGADPQTFAGLSGIGDLIVTCMSRHSRNRHLGELIGKGKSLDDALASMVQVAEGVTTAVSAYTLSRKFRVSMPITAEVNRVLYDSKPARQAIRDLMTRDAKEEDWGAPQEVD